MKTKRLVKKLKEAPDRLRRRAKRLVARKYKLALRSKAVRVAKRYGEMELSRAARLLFKFTHFQLSIRPRIRLVSAVILALIFSLIASGKASQFVQAREAAIKVNGQAILVAKNTQADNRLTPEIAGSIDAVRSPFDFVRPARGYISQGFSFYHRAIDITDDYGAPIKPLGAGRVEFTGFMADGHGNTVVIDHGNGLKSLYAHMSKINVSVGNEVPSGSTIGFIGLTGHTTGPHVHVEVVDNGISVDPAKLLPE